MRNKSVNLSVADRAAVFREAAFGRHTPMYAEVVSAHLVFMATGAICLRADVRMIFRVSTNVAVEALREAVHRLGERIDVGLVTVEAHRRLGA